MYVSFIVPQFLTYLSSNTVFYIEVNLKNSQLYNGPHLHAQPTWTQNTGVCSRASLQPSKLLEQLILVQVLPSALVVPPLPAFNQ